MATINVCDKCRKELTNRRTLLNLKKAPCNLEIKILKYDLNGWNANGNVHSFELCDNCANELAKFLGYSGPVEEEKSNRVYTDFVDILYDKATDD